MILIAGVSIILLSELRNSEAGHQSDHLIHYTDKLDNGSVTYYNYVSRSIVNGTPMEVCAPANLETAVEEAIKVCTMYPNATGDAVRKWHNALRNAGFIAQNRVVFHVVLSNSSPQTIIDGCTSDTDTTTPDPTTLTLEDRVKTSGLVILEADPLGRKQDTDGNDVPPEVYHYCRTRGEA